MTGPARSARRQAGEDAAPDAPGARWLTTAQAAARLGVKPDTLYAYASRGLLHPVRAPDGRTSRFDPAEIERLAGRGRRPEPAAPPGLLIESGLTTIVDSVPYYRGLSVVELARDWSFEEVAEWLWSGAFPASRAVWQADPAALDLARAVQAALPPATPPLDRLRVIAAALPALEPAGSVARRAPGETAARAAARSLLAAVVDALPVAVDSSPGSLPDLPPRPPSLEGRGSDALAGVTEAGHPLPKGRGPGGRSAEEALGGRSAGPLAARLWSRLSPEPPTPEMIAALDAALVVMADHELAASTLAARAAASVRADLAGVVCAGLAVAGGAWHGGALQVVEHLLAAANPPEAASPALDDRLRRGGPVVGFGHPLYPEGDPRAAVVLHRLRAAGLPAERLAVPEALLAAARARDLPPPTADLALAALAHAGRMIAGAAAAIFAVARAAGWIAHALEEYQHAAPIRPRAVYTGPPPDPSPPGRGTG